MTGKNKKPWWKLASRRQRKYLIIFSSLFALYVLFGFFGVPPLVKWILEDTLTEQLKRTSTVEDVSFNPFSLVLEVEGLTVLEPDGGEPFAGFEKVHANVEIDSIFKWALSIDELRIEGPFARVVQRPDGRFNFSDLLEGGEEPAPAEAEEQEDDSGLPIILNDLAIEGGDFTYEDQAKATKHSVAEFALRIPFASTRADDRDVYIKPFIRAKVNGRPLELGGQSKPFDQNKEAQFDLSLQALDLKPLWAYVPLDPKPELASGTFSCEIALNFEQDANQRPKLSLSGTLRLDDLNLQEANGQQLAGFKSFLVEVQRFDLIQMALACKSVVLTDPRFSVGIGESGDLNWQAYLPADEGEPEPEDAPEEDAPDQPQVDPSPPGFGFQAATIAIRNGQVRFSDKSESKDFSKEIKSIEVQLDNFSTTGAQASYQLSLSTDADEKLELSGGFHSAPISKLSGKFSAEKIRLPGYGPYFAAHLPFELRSATLSTALAFSLSDLAELTPVVTDFSLNLSQVQLVHPDMGGTTTKLDRLDLTGGKADLKENKLSLGEVAAKKLAVNLPGKSAQTAHRAGLAALSLNDIALDLQPLKVDLGQLTLTGFKLGPVKRKKKMVELQRLAVGQVQYLGQENRLDVNQVRLRGAKLAAVVDKRGNSDIGRLMANPALNPKGKSAGAPQPTDENDAPPASPFTFTVKKALLKNSRLLFTDLSVQPPFIGRVDKLEAEGRNLSSRPGSRSTLDLTAKVLQDADLEINGRFSPTRMKQDPKVAMTLTGLELSKLSAYTTKYLSYPISTGKLNLTLELSETDQKLVGEKKVRMDQFELGEEQDSEDDVGVPITLVVAILRDTQGVIALDIPISGQLSDPDFELAGVIIDALLNVVTKIIASPFTFIADMFGGGEDLNLIGMGAGSSQLTPESSQKLDTIVRVLQGRPGLKVEISGVTHPQQDRRALADRKRDLAVKLQKYEELEAQDKAPAEAGQVVLSAKEYPEYFERAWQAAGLAQVKVPADIAGDPKQALKWRKDYLSSEQTVSDDELVQLEHDRVLAVKTYLLKQEGVKAERLFSKELGDEQAKAQPGLKTGVLLGLQ